MDDITLSGPVGIKRAIPGSSPEFNIGLKAGIPELFGSQVNYSVFDIGAKYGFDFGFPAFCYWIQ